MKEGAAPATVDKEVATWRYILGHARKLGHLTSLPTDDLVLPKSGELPQHRTIAEVREIIDRKGLTESETDGLWDAIYLTTAEVAELLALVHERSRYPWIFPMFCLVAYTGMRRSSMLLSRVDEVDLRRNLVFVRSRKFERGLTESRLEVPMHPNLKSVMADWLGRHPGGQFTITPDGTRPPTRDGPTITSGTFWSGRSTRSSGASTSSATACARTWPARASRRRSSTVSWATRPKR